MSVPDERLQALIEGKDANDALLSCQRHGYSEGWAIRDGALVIYDVDDPPEWLPKDPEIVAEREHPCPIDGEACVWACPSAAHCDRRASRMA